MKVGMKKIYFKPTMRAIEIKTERILCDSYKKLQLPKKPGNVAPEDAGNGFDDDVDFE